jgi:hypothetical protein
MASLVIGRRGGKSLILALIAAFLSAFYDWSPYLTGGERGTRDPICNERDHKRYRPCRRTQRQAPPRLTLDVVTRCTGWTRPRR